MNNKSFNFEYKQQEQTSLLFSNIRGKSIFYC